MCLRYIVQIKQVAAKNGPKWTPYSRIAQRMVKQRWNSNLTLSPKATSPHIIFAQFEPARKLFRTWINRNVPQDSGRFENFHQMLDTQLFRSFIEWFRTENIKKISSFEMQIDTNLDWAKLSVFLWRCLFVCFFLLLLMGQRKVPLQWMREITSLYKSQRNRATDTISCVGIVSAPCGKINFLDISRNKSSYEMVV